MLYRKAGLGGEGVGGKIWANFGQKLGKKWAKIKKIEERAKLFKYGREIIPRGVVMAQFTKKKRKKLGEIPQKKKKLGEKNKKIGLGQSILS